eukprot:tig00001001_g6192.t1
MSVVGNRTALAAASGLFETDDAEATVKCSFTGITKETRDFGTGGLFLGLVPEERLAAHEAAPPGAGAGLLANLFDSGALQAIDLSGFPRERASERARSLRTHTGAIDDGYAEFTFPCAARAGAIRNLKLTRVSLPFRYKCALVAGSSARPKLQPGYIDERGRVSEDGFDGARPLLAACPDKVVAKSSDRLQFKLGAGFDVSEPKIDPASNRLGCSVTAPLKRCGDLAVAVSTRADLDEMARTFERVGPRVSGGRALRHVGYTPLRGNATYANAFMGVQVLRAGDLLGAVCVLASIPRRVEASHGIFMVGAESARVTPPLAVPAAPGENVNPPDSSKPAVPPSLGVLPPPANPADLALDPNEQQQRREAARLDPASPSFSVPRGPVSLLRDPIDLLSVSAGGNVNRTAEGGGGGRGEAPRPVFIVPTLAFRGELDGRLQDGPPSTWAADYRRAQGKSAPEFVVALKPFVDRKGGFSVRVDLAPLNGTRLDGPATWRLVPAANNPTALVYNVTGHGTAASIDFTRGCSQLRVPVACPNPATFAGRYAFDLEFRSSAGPAPVTSAARLLVQGDVTRGVDCRLLSIDVAPAAGADQAAREAAAREGYRACALNPECTPCVYASPLLEAIRDPERGQAFPRWGFCAPKSRVAVDPNAACVPPAALQQGLARRRLAAVPAFKPASEIRESPRDYMQRNPLTGTKCPFSYPEDPTLPLRPEERDVCLRTKGCGVCSMPNGEQFCRPGNALGPLDLSCDLSGGSWMAASPSSGGYRVVHSCRTYLQVIACEPRAPDLEGYGAARCEDGSGSGAVIAIAESDLRACRAAYTRGSILTGNVRLSGADFDDAERGSTPRQVLARLLDGADETEFVNVLRRQLQEFVDYANASAYQGPAYEAIVRSLEESGLVEELAALDRAKATARARAAAAAPTSGGAQPTPAPASASPSRRRRLSQTRTIARTGTTRTVVVEKVSSAAAESKSEAKEGGEDVPASERTPGEAPELQSQAAAGPVADPLTASGARPRDVAEAAGLAPPTLMDLACDACAGVAAQLYTALKDTLISRLLRALSCPSFVGKAIARLDKAATAAAGKDALATVMALDSLPEALDMLVLECSRVVQTRADAASGTNKGCTLKPGALPPALAEKFEAAKTRKTPDGADALPERRPGAVNVYVEYESEKACEESLKANDAVVQASVQEGVQQAAGGGMEELAANQIAVGERRCVPKPAEGPASSESSFDSVNSATGRRRLLQSPSKYIGVVPLRVTYDAANVNAPLPRAVKAALVNASISALAGGRVVSVSPVERALLEIVVLDGNSSAAAAVAIKAALSLNCTAGDAACLAKQQAGAAAACAGAGANATACKAIQERLLLASCGARGGAGGCGAALGLVCKSSRADVKELCKSLARLAVDAQRKYLAANFATLFPKGRPSSLRVSFDESLNMLVVFVRGAEFRVTSIKSRLHIQHPSRDACVARRRGDWRGYRVVFLRRLAAALNGLRADSIYPTSIRAGASYACDAAGRGSVTIEVDGLRIVQVGGSEPKQATRLFLRDEDMAFTAGVPLVPALPSTRTFLVPVPAACANFTEGYLANDDDVDFDGALVEYSIAGELHRILNGSVPGVARTSLHVANVSCAAGGIALRVALGMPANDTSDSGLYLPEALDPPGAPAGAGGSAAATPAPTALPAASNANRTRRALLLAARRRLGQAGPCAPGAGYGACLSNQLNLALARTKLFGLYAASAEGVSSAAAAPAAPGALSLAAALALALAAGLAAAFEFEFALRRP